MQFKPAVTLACLLCALPALALGADGKFLADRHAGRSVKCESCHKESPPKAPANAECLACHGPMAKLAARTDKKDINPHASHVEEARCTECHSGHKKPKLLCDQCHEFKDIRVP